MCSRWTAALSALFAVVGFNQWAVAAPSEAVLEECADCHGDKGVSTEKDVPTIAGMSPVYLSENLLFYKNEERPCVESKYRAGDTGRAPVTMCQVTQKLSDAELKELADYYAKLPFVRAKQPFDADKAKLGAKVHERYCEKCHEDAGSSAADDAGILAGQWIDYLRRSFDEYSTGKRTMIEKMQVKYEKLEAKHIDALIHFYASQQ